MANRYWAAGVSGNWNNTASWSSSATGTPAGASVPGSSDAAIFNAASGTVTATLDISPTVQTLTCTGFTGTLAFGTNTISLNSTGTVFTGATTMTVTGTPLIILNNNTASARTVTPGAVTEANSISFRVISGTGSMVFTAGSVRDSDFTDGTNPTGFAGNVTNTAITIYGNFKASTGMTRTAGTQAYTFAATSGTKTITTAAVVFDNPFTFNGVGGTWQLQDSLTSGSTRTCTLTNGTLDLNNYTLTAGIFSSSGSGVRSLLSNNVPVIITGNTAIVVSCGTTTNFTVDTRPTFNLTSSPVATTGTRTVTFAGTGGVTTYPNINVTNGSDTITTGGTTFLNNLTFSGTFTGSFGNATRSIYGNLTFKTGMSVDSGTLVNTFTGVGSQTITSAGLTLDFPITFNGVGGTFALQDALTLGSARTLTLTSGTFITNGYALSTGVVSSSNTNVRALNLGASAVTLTTTSATPWNLLDSTNMTFNAGTSTITCTSTTQNITFNGGGQTYYNIVSPNSAYNFLMAGVPVVNNLTGSNTSTAGTKVFRIDGNMTVNTLTLTGSSGNCRILLFTTPTGTQYTVTAASVSLVDADFRDIAAAGASVPWTGARLGNIGNTANITFAAGKTVYWNKAAGGYWGDDAWATVSGGATSTLNQPLGQDMAVFDNAGLTAGSTVLANAYLTGGLNCSTLTNALILQSDGTYTGFSLARNVTLSSAVSFAGTFNITLNGRTATQYITSAGVNWSCGVSIQPLATIVLVDDLNADDISFTLGPIDLNGKAIICNTFAASSTSTRSIAFNSGRIDVAGNNATVWSCADLTGFSYTGTPTVNFTYSGSTGTRTIANGSTAGGTEANAVDFNIVAGGDTFTAAAPSVVRNFTVQPAFTGTNSIFAGGTVYGNYSVHSGLTTTATTSVITFAATSGIKTITTNGSQLFRNMNFDGVGGTWQLQDALDFGQSGRALTLTNGTFDANNYSVTGTRVSSSNSNVRTLKLGSANWTMTGGTATGTAIEWDFTNSTNLTVTGTGLIVLTNFQIAVFQGGSRSWPGLVLDPNTAGTAERWIYGSNTFGSITGTTLNYSVSFEAGTTQTVNTFNVSGTAGNLVTLKSLTPGTRWNLAKNTGGKVLVSYDSITDSAASPAGYWFAPTSQGNVDGGNNTGWNFASAGGAGGFLPFF